MRIAPKAATRHVFVVADGEFATTDLDRVVAATLSDRITVSTFAIDDADRTQLRRVAERTDGESYDRLAARDLDRAFTKELARLAGDAPSTASRPSSGGRPKPGTPTTPHTTQPTTGPIETPKPPPSKPRVPGDTDGDGIPDER